jgi:AcrR family transcriptional regulator
MRSIWKSFISCPALILAMLYFLSMATTTLAVNRIAERKLRDKQARRAQIISAARRIAELEGWSNVTVRRLADEISYSQPVLYAHFGSREGILAAVAIEGFQELGLAMEKARKRVRRGSTVESVAAAYLEFAVSSPALYEVMFSLSLSVPFDDAATPPELRFAFSQLLELFPGQRSRSDVLSELFWASLHGIAELTRTKRFPRSRQKERVRALVELFTFPR